MDSTARSVGRHDPSYGPVTRLITGPRLRRGVPDRARREDATALQPAAYRCANASKIRSPPRTGQSRAAPRRIPIRISLSAIAELPFNDLRVTIVVSNGEV